MFHLDDEKLRLIVSFTIDPGKLIYVIGEIIAGGQTPTIDRVEEELRVKLEMYGAFGEMFDWKLEKRFGKHPGLRRTAEDFYIKLFPDYDNRFDDCPANSLVDNLHVYDWMQCGLTIRHNGPHIIGLPDGTMHVWSDR